MKKNFDKRLEELQQSHEELIRRINKKQKTGNGIFERFEHPVLTAQHTPLFWRYDLNETHQSLSDGTVWYQCSV